MKNRLLSDGYRTVDYKVCKTVENNYYEDLNNEIESTIKKLGCDYYPRRKDFPEGLCDGMFLNRIHHSGARCLFHNDKIITSYDLNFGPWPDAEKDKKEFQYYLSFCKYATMSNQEFEKAIGRKLTFDELVNRKPLIDVLVPRAGLNIPFLYYPIHFSRDGYSPDYVKQMIYNFYGGDTGSTEEDFKNHKGEPIRLKTKEEESADRWAAVGQEYRT